MELVSQVAGVVVLGVLVVDVFGTVFIPRGGAGVITSRLYQAAWAGWSWVATRAGGHRRRVLALAGPVLMPLTVALWVAELIAAFALIYLPVADQLSVPPSDSAPGWLASLYVSAYAATTLGVGDIYATTPALRLLITVEAGLGFALFSVAITYVLSVYGALLRASALALQITSFIGRSAGEDAVEVVCRTAHTDTDGHLLLEWLRQSAADLTSTAQAQSQYPLIAYFHIPRNDRALPLALADLLELVTLCRALPDASRFPALTSSPTIVWASRLVTTFVIDHADQLGSPSPQGDDDGDAKAYLTARQRLNLASVPLRDDHDARSRYIELRQQWSSHEQALLHHFGYTWAPDSP